MSFTAYHHHRPTRSVRSARLLAGGSALIIALSAWTAGAQEAAIADAPAQAAAPQEGVIDIIVTAQRRQERLQDAPLSVTALSSAALESRGVTNLNDVGKFAPNLELHQTNRPAGGGSAYAAYIRGVGTGDFQFPTDPGVGLYVDDVYIARAVGGLLSLEDIARVEVLKGPQGTLYGRNTIGGAINVVTTDPATNGDTTGLVKMRLGSYGRMDAAAVINTTLVEDVLGMKFSAAYISSDGYGKRLLDQQRYGSEGRLILRGGIKWNIGENADLRINADYTRQRQLPPSGYLIGFVPSGSTVAKIDRYNQYAAPYLNASLGLPASSVYDARWESESPYRIYSLQNQRDDSDIGGVSAVLNWHLSDTVSVKSITAWRKLKAIIEVDGDQTPYPIQQSLTTQKQNQFSQELQLGGTALDDRLNFLVGAYFFREKGSSTLLTRSYEGIYEALIAQGLTPTAADAGNTFTTFGMTAKSYAVFTQETLKLTDTLSITAGARFNHDRKFYSTSVMRPQNGVIVVPYSTAVASWDSFTPKLGIDWKPMRDVLLYASYSKGFKSGGFGASTVAAAPTPRYDPEKLTSYEVGAKTSWFNRRLVFNLAGFYSEYRNIQLTVQSVDPLTNANLRTTRNAGGSDIKGFEAELTAVPVRGLSFNVGAGYVDARFDSLTSEALASGFTLNSRVPQIPDWSVNAGAQYEIETGVGTWTVRGDLSYKGSQYLTAADPTSYQKAYTLYGARISYVPSWADNIELSVDGQNLTNANYAFYKSTLAPTGEYVAIPGAPRTITGTLKFTF